MTRWISSRAGAASWLVMLVAVALGAFWTSTALAERLLEGTPMVPLAVDSDGDGLVDNYEVSNGLDADDPTDAAEDPDNDGLSNLEEAQVGTDPNNPDTDGDGSLDGEEVRRGTNPVPADLALDENCVVSILNRTAQVRPDGTWMVDNVPTNFGMVRARATCVVGGVTHSGQSEPFMVPTDGSVTVGEIRFDVVEPVPQAVEITAPTTTIDTVGGTAQLTATAVFPDGSQRDVTADPVTSYVSSNPAIATVSGGGLVTAVTSGTALMTVLHEAFSSFLRIAVVLSATDTDGDGIPDDIELANGLNPNDPVDGMKDPDKDGLTNKEELIDIGTDIGLADTDGDGISDGEEIVAGADGFVTNPLVADSDGDGIRDGLEVATGSDPTDPSSFNLAAALDSLQVLPDAIVLTVNTVIGEASRQLVVTGRLRDGNTIDLTSTTKGTNYSSDDLTVCNFGFPDGNVFAGRDGTCVVTITNSGFAVDIPGSVSTFSPVPLAFVPIPGYANNVDVSVGIAYVAAGSTGLQVVDVTDPANPTIVGSQDTPGNANDVKVVGSHAFIADGSAGLAIIDISDPTLQCDPTCIVGSVDTPGTAQDVAVQGTRAYIADGAAGLQIIDISDPTSPAIIGAVDTPGDAKGVAVNPEGTLAVVADGSVGIELVDIKDPTQPVVIGGVDTGDAHDVAFDTDHVFVADFSSSFTSVDVSDAANPVVRDSTTSANGGLLLDAVVSGRFGFGADVFFVNGVPIIDVSAPDTLVPRTILDFSAFRDDNGTGIAVDSNFVYLTASTAILENGTSGDTRLYVGQYLALKDTSGVPPVVEIIAPQDGDTVVEGATLPIRVDASDDIAVVAVDFLVDGTQVSSDDTRPYEFNFTVPQGIASLSVGARAFDLGGNAGTASEVTVSVIPDPRTTVVGRVVDRAGTPAAGAEVSCLAAATVSGVDGTFSVDGVPTVNGAISCTAVFTTMGGATLLGTSAAVPPILAGVTDVGDIILGESTYYGFNPNSQGRLIVVGWTDNTELTVTNLDTGIPIISDTINRFDVRTIGLGATRHFKLATSSAVQATLGFDCCNFGGSFFYPAIDGRKRVGREFIIRAPVLSSANELILFAYEDSDVTVRDTAGTVVLNTAITGDHFFSTTGAPLAAATVYHVESSGDIAIMSNSENAHASVPTRDGTDVGSEFLCGVYQWTESSVAVFNYEQTQVEVGGINLATSGQLFGPTAVAPGGVAYFAGLGSNTKLKVSSTGRIGLWCGSTEGGGGISFMGDDLTMNTGDAGRDIVVHSQTQGAFVFAFQDGTTVNINGSVSILNADQFIDLATGTLFHISADKPVVVETIGGNGLNDWETALRLVP